MQWRECEAAPLPWFQLRELLLFVVQSPALLLTLLGVFVAVLARVLRLPRVWSVVAVVLFPLAASLIYSPTATALLSAWLQHQTPSPPPPSPAAPVVVLVGRGPTIAQATTRAAATQFHQRGALAVYVSGDERATAQRLLGLGVPPNRVFGDSCARTTWENAKLTNDWLRQHHPAAPVLLMTDPWQLPRASRAFLRSGMRVTPLPVDPPLPFRERNRLALRETAATLLYSLQGRL
jgi:uncharacterized SAM-binding protein YcdF (DUF218 family)